jgi:tetratricopeptide (TPR) repeat protein
MNTKLLLYSVIFLFSLGKVLGQTNTTTSKKDLTTAAFSISYTLVAEKKYDEALLNFITVYDESSYEINLRLAYLYYLAGKHAESIEFYQKSMALKPNAIEPLWAILYPYEMLEKWTDIERTYYSILKFDPQNVAANYNLGYMYYYRKDYTRAKKFFDVCLTQFPFTYNYMLMSAWTNYFLGNTKEAKNLFIRTMYYNPKDASAAEGLALIK